MVENGPQTYEEESEHSIWKTSIKEEYHSLQKNETWELVNLPLGRKLVKWKWVFKEKFVSKGYPINDKARLVAKGFFQFQWIDYNDTFAPIANMDSVRLVLAIASSKQWEVHHMDVKSDLIHFYMKE